MGRGATIATSALAVAVVGAVLSFAFGVAGQGIARSWQREDKRLEVRTTLVREVSRANADMVGAVWQRGAEGGGAGALDAAYGRWLAASSTIGAELGAYVGGRSDVETQWQNFRTNMARVYYAFRGDQQRHWLGLVAAYIAPRNRDGELSVLDGLLGKPATVKQRRTYESSLRELVRGLQQRADAIDDAILSSPTTV
jgi:hypothetical protein